MSVNTAYRGFNVRVDQMEWLREEAARREISVNALIRQLIDDGKARAGR